MRDLTHDDLRNPNSTDCLRGRYFGHKDECATGPGWEGHIGLNGSLS